MKKFLLTGWVALLAALPLSGQTREEEAVLAVTGEADMEAFDPSEIERFEHYARHPLRINLLSRSRLLSSGLLTQYQVATLLDYRRSEGDILSVTELALVDGFDTQTARALAPFLSFESVRKPGETAARGRTEQEMTVRTAFRREITDDGNGAGRSPDDADMAWGGRYRINHADRWEAAVSGRTVYGDDRQFPPSGRSAYAVLYGKRHLGQVIAGSFNARFGQGLALWSGFSMSGVASPLASFRRPSGLSPSWSYAGTGLKGTAADFNFGRWTFSAFQTLPAPDGTFLTGGNAAWFGRHGQVSSTWVREGERLHKWALDGRFCWKGMDVFAEAARDLATGTTAALAGIVVPVGDRSRASLLLRTYPTGYTADRAGAVRSSTKVTDETGAALGFSSGGTTLSLDGAWHPSKQEGQVKLLFSDSRPVGRHWTVRTRLSERLRSRSPRNRTDVRADLLQEYGPLAVNVRVNGLLGKGLGLLGYVETGLKGEKAMLWLRGTAFRIDDWDDRIYAYERDAPGNFSVPAYYGRGYALSCYGGWKVRRWKCWLRASLLRYPWMTGNKPGRAELKWQLSHEW